MKRAILIIWLTTLKLWAFQIFREKVHVLHEHHQIVSMSWLPWVFMIIIKDRLSVQCKLSHSNGNPWSDWKAFALIQSLKKEDPLSVIWRCIARGYFDSVVCQWGRFLTLTLSLGTLFLAKVFRDLLYSVQRLLTNQFN